ncbi:MAG: pyridoxamine 5'-phosphate oxidase family protein [Actinomycetota bacterium]
MCGARSAPEEAPRWTSVTRDGPSTLEIRTFLDEPVRPAQVASVSPSGLPVLGSFWFVFEGGRFWFSSRLNTPLTIAVAHGSEVAVLVDDFTPPNSIRQVRIRGVGKVESHDPSRVERIYRRYLGNSLAEWPDFFRARLTDPTWALWSVTPSSGLAVTSPSFEPVEIRWQDPSASPLPR